VKPQGITALAAETMSAVLEDFLLPKIAADLRMRAPGHCMRVADLDENLSVSLCRRLREEVPNTQVFVLSDAKSNHLSPGIAVTSTKLVELRNPLPDGSLRPPLLVFLPPNLRTSAEDSFGIATFEQVSLPNPYTALLVDLFGALPQEISGAVSDIIKVLRENKWLWADDYAICRFLLTIRENGNDPQVVGAAVYEFGLVPHFKLLEDPSRVPWQIHRNSRCVTKITFSEKTERGRVLDLELQDPQFRLDLGSFLEQHGVEDPRTWSRRIALDSSAWRFSFDKWRLPDADQRPDQICIDDVVANLPRVPDDTTDARLRELVGQPYLPLGEGGIHNFDVTFTTNPPPNRVNRLSRFLVQLVSRETGPVGAAKAKNKWSSDKTDAKVRLTRLNKLELEEGWYFVRVRAVTDKNEFIPLVDRNGEQLTGLDSDQNPNESDLFYVLPGGTIDQDTPPRTVPRAESVVHAAVEVQIKAVRDGRAAETVQVTHCEWVPAETKSKAIKQDEVEVRFGRDGVFRVPVSRTLRDIEQRILTSPARLVSYGMRIEAGVIQPVTQSEDLQARSSAVSEFRDARKSFCSAIAGLDRATGNQPLPLVCQASDLAKLEKEALAYAQSFHQWIASLLRTAEVGSGVDQQRALTELRSALALDSIVVTLTNHRGKQKEAVLVGPTNPLRALWLVCWARLARFWAQQVALEPKKYGESTQRSLLDKLAPVNFPAFMPVDKGRVFTTVDAVHPFWSLYAPTREEDPRGLLGDVCTALGLPEPATFGAAISAADIADRVHRYILQHPYVRTLTINVFNAGRASAIADILLLLQSAQGLSDLCYDIRLFVMDPAAPGVGESIEALFSPESTVSTPEADAFLTPTGSHLFPKLAFAVRSVADFKEKPSHYPAHISMLFDLFPAEEVGAAPPVQEDTALAVYGLIQEFDTQYLEEDSFVIWKRQPRHGVAQPLVGSELLTEMLSTLPETISQATAVVAAGQVGPKLRPVVSLPLRADERAILHQVHECSDWVFTIDRNLGLEFFDHGRSDRPDYLIDYSLDQTSYAGHRFVVSSRSLAELEAMLRPALKAYKLSAEGNRAAALLSQLRSLSGRLALKLISSPTQRAEVLGLALARLYLGYQGAIANQVVVPLDSHLDLYKAADETGESVTLQRTDLALFDLDAKARTIRCRLVEVKCYRDVGSLGSYQQLRTRIEQQIKRSEEVIRQHFDAHLNASDRPDRQLKNRELANLLEFYLDRGVRYKIIHRDVEEEARYLLRTLDYGYSMEFSRSALVFDFEKPGTEHPQVENGIEYHRIGFDLIKELVEAVGPQTLTAEGMAGVSETESTVPRLGSAAFLSQQRDRTVSWSDLRRQRTLGEDSVGDLSDLEQSTPAVPLSTEPSPQPPALEVQPAVQAPALHLTPPSAPAPPARPEPGPTATGAESAQPSLGTDIIIGVNSQSPQFGILGDHFGRKIGLDLNQTQTISLFGIQGGGKSYTLGTVVEMATIPIPGINVLPSPLGTVIFHYSSTQAYSPEFVTMGKPNSDQVAITTLLEKYGASPRGIDDVVLLAPADKVAERRGEFPDLTVLPLAFSSHELQASHWRFLMGAVGSQSLYMKQVNHLMRDLRQNLTLQNIQAAVGSSGLPDNLKALAQTRLNLARHYIDDAVALTSIVKPGRLVIVDLRDEFLEKDEALGLFVVVLQLVSDALHAGKRFNKLVVFDEAHKYIENPDLVAGLVEVIREMRHKGTSVMVASQDPLSVPVSVIELSSQIILHRFNAPTWLKHIQRANTALGSLTPDKLNSLAAGEAYVWSSKATDSAFTTGPLKVRCRPRVTLHGGTTQTAVD
jgi:DNA phosphorothioation-dependent restriction protein DptH